MLELLLPPSCAVCGREGEALCRPCVESLPAAGPVDPPPGLDGCVALVAYEGPGRALVAGLKFHNRRTVASIVGRALAGAVDADVAAVTWVPTSPARRRARGFDQARVLAAATARALGRPCLPTLERLPGPAQTGRGRLDRLEGPHLAPRFRHLPAGRLLLVDDVVTTGATLTAAATVLGQAGVDPISAAVLARTL